MIETREAFHEDKAALEISRRGAIEVFFHPERCERVFEGWSWSGSKEVGEHKTPGVHDGSGVYALETKTYDWLTDFGDWPILAQRHIPGAVVVSR